MLWMEVMRMAQSDLLQAIRLPVLLGLWSCALQVVIIFLRHRKKK